MQRSARKIAVALLLVAALTGGVWYVLVGAPEYSLYQLGRTIQAHDVKAAERYLDVDSVARDAAETVVEYARSEYAPSNQAPGTSSSNAWERLGQLLGQGLIEVVVPAVKAKIEDSVKEAIRQAIAEGRTATKLFTVPTSVRELRSRVRVERDGPTAIVTMYEGTKEVSKFKMALQWDRTWKVVALDREWLLASLRESSPPISLSPPISVAQPPSPTRLSVVLASRTTPVNPGSMASITVRTAPGAVCTITVTYMSGPSQAQGLESKAADTDGVVSWIWRVGTATTQGEWPITVICSGEDSQATLETSFIVQ